VLLSLRGVAIFAKANPKTLVISLAVLLAIGMSWSHIRRRLSGQVDVDVLKGPLLTLQECFTKNERESIFLTDAQIELTMYLTYEFLSPLSSATF
jgi:hypothetical protein